jgi:hypothetical protein
LPDAYNIDGVCFCGIHNERMAPYRAPENFLFIEHLARGADDQFPNAKLWGDAPEDTEGIHTHFCASCEADHQRWLQAKRDQAIVECTAAIRLNPEDGEACCKRAVAYYDNGEYDNAWADIEACWRLGGYVYPELLVALRKASGKET